MAETQVLLWLLRRALHRPSCWLLLALLGLIPIVLLVLHPFGTADVIPSLSRSYYSVAFLAGLAGAVFALGSLAELEGLFPWPRTLRRLRLELVVLALLSVGSAGLVLLPLLWLAPSHLLPISAGIGLALALARVTALGFLLLRIPSLASLGSIALPFLAWVVPSVGLPMSSPLTVISTWLDATDFLRFHVAPPAVVPACASILALLLTAFGLHLWRRPGS